MTTTPRKTNSHKKARAIRSGFLELINTFVLTPRQRLAAKLTSFRSVVKRHENDNSITVCEIAPVQADKSTSIWFLTTSQSGGM
ncbi:MULTISPECIES: hypothetical protein [unclassified Psychrobacter]|uniref:hypothetical protein n=1 Tax=unclassified Psychrobacter TaxID=196806 RepID=UPI000714C4B2|nr:hypothetical protein [Psychrobacter sp. P11F6]KRG34222.1 hypothetical protein AK822_04745 [Psychrobacter sp. P11F6]